MKTILVAESDNKVREELAGLLSMANYQIHIARNGKEAIEITQKCRPDLILSAITMPVIDGFGMLYLLRHNPQTEGIPVIFMASKANKNDFRYAMESGADDFIIMPVQNDDLLKAVESRFRRLYVIRKNIAADLQKTDVPVPVKTHKAKDIRSISRGLPKKTVFCHRIPSKLSLHFICNDTVTIYKAYEDGKQIIVGLYNNDGFLGYAGILMDSTCKKLMETMTGEKEKEMLA